MKGSVSLPGWTRHSIRHLRTFSPLSVQMRCRRVKRVEEAADLGAQVDRRERLADKVAAWIEASMVNDSIALVSVVNSTFNPGLQPRL